MAKGFTTIYNAACEPYIQQLCLMLNRMGARISGIASNLLTIEGVRELHGTEHTLLPDMIEVGSFIGLAAMTRSELTIRNVSFENLGIIPAQFARLGIRFEQHGDDIYIPQQEHYRIENFMDGSIMTIADAPWPGLTPDLLSVFLVVATQAKGSVLIHQKMFESRLFFVDKLIDMGAQIILCDPHRATVIGHDHQMRLRATRMTSPDIRAGVALLIAAMSAEGTSTIQNIEQIDRGYKDIDGRLNALGARITRSKSNDRPIPGIRKRSKVVIICFWKMQPEGWIEVICGSMFSGKTEELIRRLKRAEFARLRVEIFKPRIDVRYSEEEVVSHDASAIRSTPVDSAQNILLMTSDAMSWASTRRSSSTRD